jgi:hypothetical protein
MVQAVLEKKITLCELQRMRQKELGNLYPQARRTTLQKCRVAALAELNKAPL